MDNGKCIMDNDCIAFGDDFKLFPKEIPQLSIIHLRDSATNGNWYKSPGSASAEPGLYQIIGKTLGFFSYLRLCFLRITTITTAATHITTTATAIRITGSLSAFAETERGVIPHEWVTVMPFIG